MRENIPVELNGLLSSISYLDSALGELGINISDEGSIVFKAAPREIDVVSTADGRLADEGR